MRLSIIFELLLILLLIAFAAYARVIHDSSRKSALKKVSHLSTAATPISLKQATENVNKYCVCNENICNCCRDFHIPLVQLSGPGCASLQYLQENKLAMQLSIGDNILSSNIVNGNNPKPVCVTLPGGFSKFCGKIYSIKKDADKHFKACLGLELRSASELEASLRVSCFRFGPDGLKLRPAEPLPPTISAPSSNADDEYDDIFSLGDDDDEDDDDDDEEETENDDFEKVSEQTSSSSLAAAAEQENQEQAIEEDDDDDDLLGLSALLDIFTSDDDSTSKKKKKASLSTALPTSFTIPILALTTSSPVIESHSSVIPITTASSISNKGSTATSVTTSRSYSTTAASNHDIQKISTEHTDETTAVATFSSDDNGSTDNTNISHEDQTTITSIGIAEASNASLDTEKLVNASYDKKSKINSTEIKQSDKKKVGSITKLADDTTKINKLGTKQQIIASSTDADDSSESIYDDENDDADDADDADDDDDEVSEESNSDIKQIVATINESDKTDYGQSYEESDEDEDEDADIQVMSTLLDDQASTEKKDRPKANIKTKKVYSKREPAAPTRADYDYQLSEILARKHSNRTNTKGVKRKNTLKNGQN